MADRPGFANDWPVSCDSWFFQLMQKVSLKAGIPVNTVCQELFGDLQTAGNGSTNTGNRPVIQHGVFVVSDSLGGKRKLPLLTGRHSAVNT